MPRYFIVAHSFAAPFCSDTSTQFRGGPTPQQTLEAFAASYKHPSGLYAAALYADANAYHEGDTPLAKWLSNHEQAKQAATKGKEAYEYKPWAAGQFEIDGKPIEVENPKGGSLV